MVWFDKVNSLQFNSVSLSCLVAPSHKCALILSVQNLARCMPFSHLVTYKCIFIDKHSDKGQKAVFLSRNIIFLVLVIS